MRIRPLTFKELESIESTRQAYRAMWATLKGVPDRRFDGGRDDIDALDFIEYEAGDHPEGLAGAAVIWGGVLAATGVVSWSIADGQHWVLTADPVYPRAMIFPYARLIEIQNSSVPQYGKYEWLLEEAVLALSLRGFRDEDEERLRVLVRSRSESFVEVAKQMIDWLGDRGEKPSA